MSVSIENLCYSFELDLALGKRNTIELNSRQSIFVRERDIDYQVLRMGQFSKLLRAYPYKKDFLLLESRKDIPPIYRGKVWAALLDVMDRARREFKQIDTITEQVSDRQLQVDIPRCHQVYLKCATSSITRK
jgi:hypothetical protein